MSRLAGHYNHSVVGFRLPFRAVWAALLAALWLPCAAAQLAATASPELPSAPQGRLLLVLPFENRSSQPSLDWIGEAVPEVLNTRLASAGFMPIGRSDRLYALDHLGLPSNFQPSRASMLRLAQALDADYVLSGSFTMNGGRLQTTARILDVNALRLLPPLDEQADLNRLLDILNSLAWRSARQLDPKYAVAEQTFVATNAKLRLDAFEQYVRGLVEQESSERIKHLKEAVRLSPDFYAAWLALGKAYFADQQFELAAATFSKLPASGPQSLEADFYRGLACFYTGSYSKAEEAFARVASLLPLPEVVNNQGVAASRHGRDGSALFQQAIASDPRDGDYHFNLAVALKRRGDATGAQREIDQAVKLRPQESEFLSFAAALKAVAPGSATRTVSTVDGATAPSLPLERIKRGYSEASFRQAAFEIEQVQAMQLAARPAGERAAVLARQGSQYLGRGLILESEREFQAAVAADPSNAAAHAGLAQIRERSGDKAEARAEAQKSLQLQPGAAAYLVLARLALQANDLSGAATATGSALKLEPDNAAARGMRQALEARGQQVP